MKQQIIIRGAAIVIAGVAASTYAAQNLLNRSPATPPASSAQVTAEPSEVLGAGLVSAGQNTLSKRDSGAEQAEALPGLEQGLTASSPVTDTMMIGDQFAALQDDAPPRDPVVGTDLTNQIARVETDSTGSGEHCAPQLSAIAGIDALIKLKLDAPCHQNERVVVSHGDLAFSGQTSQDGVFSSYLPALAREAKVDVFLSDDLYLQTSVTVEGVEDHLRVILQWSGDGAFGLHAYHDGADFGGEGHIHASRPFDPNHDEAFLISLGTQHGPEPMLAEVYSIPTNLAAHSRVEVEMRYSDRLCGRDLSAYVLQAGSDVDGDVKEITFAAPDCPADTGSLIMPLSLVAPKHLTLSAEHATEHAPGEDYR